MYLIYVRLLDEGTDVLRPVKARQIREGVFEIAAFADYASLEEQWQFPPGSLVKCMIETHGDKQIFVAQERM